MFRACGFVLIYSTGCILVVIGLLIEMIAGLLNTEILLWSGACSGVIGCGLMALALITKEES